MVSCWKEEEKRDTRGKKQREKKETRETHTSGSFGKE
tara:strand:+ start:1118 stop:1228 length:111 start_codon:yes stop_codon:yes gene_type:complete